MNRNQAPVIEDLSNPVIDVSQSIGELAVTTYDESTTDQNNTVVTQISFDSFL